MDALSIIGLVITALVLLGLGLCWGMELGAETAPKSTGERRIDELTVRITADTGEFMRQITEAADHAARQCERAYAVMAETPTRMAIADDVLEDLRIIVCDWLANGDAKRCMAAVHRVLDSCGADVSTLEEGAPV